MSISKKTKSNHKIAIIPGDGIGKEVLKGSINVLNNLNIDFEYVYGEAGDEAEKIHGTPLPKETIKIIKESDACLFGAVGETAADVIIRLRQDLNLFANIRPVKSYPNTKAFFDDLDFVIIRENTEGLYISSKEKYFNEGAIAKRVITKKAEERIIEYAFQYAIKNKKKKVAAAHKANVLKKTDGLFRDIFYKIAKKYPNIEVEDLYVDATAMYLLTNPKRFDVIVTTNIFGDILSDEGAGLVGGLGLVPSANIGENYGLFEPVHGSAPDIAGKNIANPIATLLSAVMMLKYLEEDDEAERLESAIIKTLIKSENLTPDLGGSSTTSEISETIKKYL